METEIIVPDEQALDTAPLTVLDDLPDNPQDRAVARFSRLKTTFASTLAIIAAMYQDRDWEHLSRDDGTPYTSMAEVLSDALGVSMSMARRYLQGARDFYFPLSQVVVDGTRIEITSGDVASLGKDGLAQAVEHAQTNLEGVDDPEQAGEIVDESLAWAKERKEGQKAQQQTEAEGWDEAEGDWGGYGEDPSKPGAGARQASADGVGFAGDDDLIDDLPTGVAGSAGQFVDSDEDSEDDAEGAATASAGSQQDPISEVLDGAATYDTDESLRELPAELQEIYAAMRTLSQVDPDAAAALVDYETRGFMLPMDEAIERLSRVRALVETSGWLMSKLAL